MTLGERKELIEKLSIEVATICSEYHDFNQTMSLFMIEVLKDIKELREEVGLTEGE